MENNQKSFCQYHRMIWKRALCRAWDKLGAWGTFISLIIAIVASILINRPKSFLDFMGRDVVIAGGILIGLFVLVMLYYISWETVKVYNEKQSQLDTQKSMISPEVIFKLSQYRPEAGGNGVRWAGVYIENKSGIFAIEKCKSRLLSITPSINTASNLPSELIWSSNNHPDENGFLLIQRDSKVSLDIARSSPNYETGIITLRRGDNTMEFLPGEYSIVFSIEGYINSFSFPSKQYSAKIILEKGKDIRIEEIRLFSRK